MKNILLLGICFFMVKAIAQPPGYSFGKHIFIQESQIPGTANLTNFPMLVSFTDNDLRHTTSGGNVQNINGYDIVFTSGDCSTILSHEIESYNPTTGNLVAWVRIPSLSATTNTGIHMYYGNNGVATNPSTSATWSAGYNGVWHLHNDFLDASGNSNNGTNNGSVDVSPAMIADGQNFTDPNHWIELTNHPNVTGNFSCTAWFRSSDVSRAGQRIICDDATNANGCWAISLGDPGAGRLRFYIRGLSVVSHDTGNIIANNTWYHVAIVFDNASTPKTKSLYVNGALIVSGTVTGTLGTPTGNASIGGEIATGETANRFQGDIDEVRSIPAVLSANWIAAEYNNQNNPSTFYTISAQMTANDLCALLPVELINFEAMQNDANTILLKWATGSERNNDYFSLEKSIDGIHWNSIGTIDGHGNSSHLIQYSYVDDNPTYGINYYRLKQVDFDGSFEHSSIINFVYLNVTNEIKIFPNPISDVMNIHFAFIPESFKIYNQTGIDVTEQIKLISAMNNNASYDCSNLKSGVYIFVSGQTQLKFIKL